jgi:hypothetical protein
MKIGNFIITVNKIKPKQELILHNLNSKLIEYCFTIDKVDYYTFKNFLDFPPLRHAKINHFMREVDMSITVNDLKEYVKSITDGLNGGDIKKAIKTLSLVEYQLESYSELDILYRLCSAVFFDLSEDIKSYDFDYNNKKIDTFKKEMPEDFFLMNSVNVLFPQINLSKENIQMYLVTQEVAKRFQDKLKSESI